MIDTIINLINKTRSFNYQCFLCFQVTDDLSTDKKKLFNTIFGNVGNIIAHKVSNVESPEYIAKVFLEQEQLKKLLNNMTLKIKKVLKVQLEKSNNILLIQMI